MIYEPKPGENITETAKTIALLAASQNEAITGKFNDIDFTCKPGDTAESVVMAFNNTCERRREVYINSDEYKQRQREAEERDRRKKLILDGALLAAKRQAQTAGASQQSPSHPEEERLGNAK